MAYIPKVLNGKVVLEVWLLDNSYKTLLIEPSCTVLEVCRMMAEKIGFEDPEDDALCFSLNECPDGATIERSLRPNAVVLSVMEGWFNKPKPKFIFQIYLFTQSIMNSSDPKIIHMLFIQNVYNVISGLFPTSEKDVIQLAALQFQAKFGKHKSETHRPGFLRNLIVEYIPSAHIEANPQRSVEQWEELIFHKHAFSATDSPRETYLSILRAREYYGSVFFAVRQRFDRSIPKRVLMGLSRNGISLLRMPLTRTEGDLEVLRTFVLSDIYRWAYKVNESFYFEVKYDDGSDNPVYSFDTPEGVHMSNILTDYAMALLREMNLNPDGTHRVKPKDAKAAALAMSALPNKDALAASEDAYKDVAGGVGALASAAVRSKKAEEESESTSAEDQVEASEEVAEGEADPEELEGEAHDEEEEEDLPEPWEKHYDETNEQYYYFNTETGDSVWNRDEIPLPESE